MTRKLQIDVRDTLAGISAEDWNALNDDGNPFLRHEFLHNLDKTGCLGRQTGWFPRYFLLWDGADDQRELVGGVAAYVKTNSYGEFVFDWAWAEAYERHQLNYYPKLVVSIPFTPATGPRLLIRADQPYEETIKLLASALRQFAVSQDYSSLHFLFLTDRESRILSADAPTTDELDKLVESASDEARRRQQQNEDGNHANGQESDQQNNAAAAPSPSPSQSQSQSRSRSRSRSKTDRDVAAKPYVATVSDHLRRIDCQYHWHNKQYQSFEHFLSGCTAKRRKTIRRERRYVSDAGLRLERRSGDSLSIEEWQWVHEFYASTFDRKWGNPSLTEAFFCAIGSDMGSRVLIVFAYDVTDEQPERPVACSIMFIGDHTLYGRFWGCRRDYHSLHFEACYYQGIEYCIEHGKLNFEPGAQGEHKITRGFEPTLTQSAHYIAHVGFRAAIANFLAEETPYMEQRCTGLADLLPFKSEPLVL